MPLYTVKNTKTEDQWDVTCSYDELQKMLNHEPDLVKVVTVPNFSSSGGKTHMNSKTDDNWKDLLGRIKKGSGRGNTIKT